jgi:hypothetical protein
MAGLDNKISNIIGTKIPQWVLNQLGTRSIQNSKDSRDNDNIIYLANKSAWIRLVSSVDVVAQNDLSYFKNIAGSDIQDQTSLAKQFVLFGGTSKYLNKNSYQLRSGIGQGGAYGTLGESEINAYGYKPMPGITSVNIDTQGRLGSIRAATINFKCWDKSQLDIIDALYFKLGFTMFLEWGHTYFYPNFENNQKLDPNKIQSTELYSIDPFESKLNKEQIFRKISQNSRDTEGNYDAMLGIVTNFNFTYTQDGGYDCTLRLMSLGVLGDSIKINSAPNLPDLLQEEITKYNNTLARIEKARLDAEAAKNAAATQQFSQENILNELEKQAKLNDLLQPISVGYLKDYYENLTRNEKTIALFNTIAFDSTNPISEEAKKDFRKWLQSLKIINRDYVVVPSDFGRVISRGSTDSLNLYKLENKDFYNLDYYISENETYILGRNANRGNVVISNNNTYTNVDINLSYLKNRVLKDRNDKNETQSNVETLNKLLESQNLQNLYNNVNIVSSELLTSNESKLIGASSSGYIRFALTYTSPSVSKDLTKDAYFFNIAINRNLKDKNGKVWATASDKTIYEVLNEITRLDSINGGTIVNTNNTNQLNNRSFRKLQKPRNNDVFLVSKVVDNNLDSNPNYWYFSVQYNYPTNLSQKIKITNYPKEATGARTSTGALVSDYVETESFTNLDLYLEVTISFNDSTLIQSITPNNPDDILRVDNPTDQNKSPESQQTNPGQSTDPTQTKQAITSQSSLELILRTIQVRSLTNAINKSGLDIGRKVYNLKLYEETKFLKQIFSTGLMSSFITDLASDSANIKDSNYDTSEEERFKINCKYGFATSLLGYKEEIGIITKNNFIETLNAYAVPYEINQEITKGTDVNHPVYIPFGLLLMILNHCCTIYDTKKGSTFQTPLVYVDFNNQLNFFLCNGKQLSTNPWKVLIPFEGTNEDYKKLFDPSLLDKGGIKALSGSTEVAPLFTTQEDALSKSILPVKYTNIDSSVYRGKIMNILLNIEYLIDLVKDNSYKDGGNNVYLKPFIEQILFDVNKYLGDFNSFRLSYNDQANTFQIVDDQFIPSIANEIQWTKNDKPDSPNTTNRTEIPLVGKYSIAKSLEIKTDISSKLANMIAISSNSTIENKATLSNNGDSFGYVNTNFQDRYITDKLELSGSKSQTSKDLETLKIAARHFNQTVKDFYTTINPSETNVSDATNYYIEKMSKVKNNEKPTRAAAMIPVSINFSTDGISGLGMGQSFTVADELLPYSYDLRRTGDYDNNVGFAMVGLNHSIENNTWNTTVRANMIYLKDRTVFNVSASRPNSSVNQFGVNTANYFANETNSSLSSFIEKTPWSAAFISYVMLKAGTNFPANALHTNYLNSLQNSSEFELLNPISTKVSIGDLIVFNREQNNQIYSSKPYSGVSHGDIIISADANIAEGIGGNVSDSVTKSQFSLNNGIVAESKIFVIVRYKNTANISKIINAAKFEYNLWSSNNWKETSAEAYPKLKEYYSTVKINLP